LKYRVLFLSMLAVALGGCGGGGGGSEAAAPAPVPVPVPTPTPTPTPTPVVFAPKVGEVAVINLDTATQVLKSVDGTTNLAVFRNNQALMTADGQGLVKWEYDDLGPIGNVIPRSLIYTADAGKWSAPVVKGGESKVYMNSAGVTAFVQNDALTLAPLNKLAQQIGTTPVTLPSDWPYLKTSSLAEWSLISKVYGKEETMPNRILSDGSLVGFGQNTADTTQPIQYSLYKYTAAGGVVRTPLENVLPRYLSPTVSADPVTVPLNSRPSIAGNGEVLPVLSWCSIDAAHNEGVILGAVAFPGSSTVFTSFLIAKIPSLNGYVDCPNLESSNAVGNGGNTQVAAVAWTKSIAPATAQLRFATGLSLASINLAGGTSVAKVEIANNDAVEIPQYALSTAPSGTTTIAWVEVTHGQNDSQPYRAPNRIAWRSYTPYNPLTKAAAVLTPTAYLPADAYGNGLDAIHLVAGPAGTLAAVGGKKPATPTHIEGSKTIGENSTVYAAKFNPQSGWTVPKKLATIYYPLSAGLPLSMYDLAPFATQPKAAINASGQAIATFMVPAWCGEDYSACKSAKYYLMSSAF